MRVSIVEPKSRIFNRATCMVLKTTFVILALFIGISGVQGQGLSIEEKEKKLLAHTKKDTTRVKLLNSLIYSVSRVDPNKAESLIRESEYLIDSLNFRPGKAQLLYYSARMEVMKYNFKLAIEKCHQAIKIYDSLNNKKGVAYSLGTIGGAYHDQDDFSNAIKYYERSAEISQKSGDLIGYAGSLDNIAIIRSDQGAYEEAISYFQKSKQIKEELNDSIGIAQVYTNMGSIYGDQDNFPKALELTNKALYIYDRLNDESRKTRALFNIAVIYINQEKFDEASEYYDRIIDIYEKQKNKYEVANCMVAKAYIFSQQGKQEKALSILNETLDTYKEVGSPSGMSNCLNHIGDIHLKLENDTTALRYYTQILSIQSENLSTSRSGAYQGIAKVYLRRGEYKKALENLQQAEKIIIEMGFLDSEKGLYDMYAQVYGGLGNYKKAFESHQRFKLLSDSLFNKENIKKITQLEYEYKYKQELESAEKRELKLNEKVKSTTKDLKKSQQNSLIAVIIILFISLISVIIIFVLKLRHVEAINQNILIEQKLLRSQMTPHFMFNSLSVLQGMILSKEEDKSVQYLSEFSKLLRTVLENSRHKSVSLSKELQAIGSYMALQNLDADPPYDYSMSVHSSINEDEINIPPMLIQPFIENAIEHAFPHQKNNREIKVDIRLEKGQLICTIEDNGIGINHSISDKKKGSLATVITSERLDMLSKDFTGKGSVDIKNKKMFGGKGTLVTLVIPYKMELNR